MNTLLLLLIMQINLTQTPIPEDIKEQTMLIAVNEYRITNNLPAVTESAIVCTLSDTRIKQIPINFNHKAFKNNTQLPYGTWYENLAEEGTKIHGIDGVLAAWKKSPKHNQNLLSDMKHICIRNEKQYWVLNGWKPYTK